MDMYCYNIIYIIQNYWYTDLYVWPTYGRNVQLKPYKVHKMNTVIVIKISNGQIEWNVNVLLLMATNNL